MSSYAHRLSCQSETTQFILKAVELYPHLTARELAERINMPVRKVDEHLHYLHAAQKVHITGWAMPKTKGTSARRLTAGPGIDVPRPPIDRAAKRRRANALARARRAHSERKPAGHFQYVITSGPFAGLGA